jgi:hypothetical protein
VSTGRGQPHIDAEEFYRLFDGVVIDDTRLFNEKLQEWEDFCNFHRPTAPSTDRPSTNDSGTSPRPQPRKPRPSAAHLHVLGEAGVVFRPREREREATLVRMRNAVCGPRRLGFVRRERRRGRCVRSRIARDRPVGDQRISRGTKRFARVLDPDRSLTAGMSVLRVEAKDRHQRPRGDRSRDHRR